MKSLREQNNVESTSEDVINKVTQLQAIITKGSLTLNDISQINDIIDALLKRFGVFSKAATIESKGSILQPQLPSDLKAQINCLKKKSSSHKDCSKEDGADQPNLNRNQMTTKKFLSDPLLPNEPKKFNEAASPPPAPPLPPKAPPLPQKINSSNIFAVKNEAVPQRTPKVKMKTLQWKPLRYIEIQSNGQNIWNKCQEVKLTEMNWDHFESLFSQPKPEKLQTFRSLTDLTKTIDIDSKKLFAINIVLKTVKRSPEEVCSLIKNFDAQTLGIDILKQLETALPSATDEKKIRAFDDPTCFANPGEQFFIMLLKMKNYRTVIRGMIYREEFPPTFLTLKIVATKIIAACDIAIKSSTIPIFFKYILYFGNYMNSNTKMGNAFGFTLPNLLTNILGSKSKGSELNLLYYLTLTMKQCHPDDYDTFLHEILQIHDAVKFGFIDLKDEMVRLRTNYHTLNDRINCSEENIKLNFQAFITDAGNKITGLESTLRDVNKMLNRFGNYMCIKGHTLVYFETLNLLGSFYQELNSLESYIPNKCLSKSVNKT